MESDCEWASFLFWIDKMFGSYIVVIAIQLCEYLKNHWVVMRRKTSDRAKILRGKWIITFKLSLEKKLNNIKINPKKWKNKGNKDEKK